ncbi:MAG: extracellular solute-binding protein [Microthrixaceae bacterium]
MLIETSTSATLIDQITSNPSGLDLSQVLDPATAEKYKAFNGFKVNFTVGVAPAPGPDGTKDGQVAGSVFYLTRTGSDAVTSAAWDFVKYFNQVDNQTTWTRLGSYLPVRAAVQKGLADDPQWGQSQRGRWITTAFDALKTLDAKFPDRSSVRTRTSAPRTSRCWKASSWATASRTRQR